MLGAVPSTWKSRRYQPYQTRLKRCQSASSGMIAMASELRCFVSPSFSSPSTERVYVREGEAYAAWHTAHVRSVVGRSDFGCTRTRSTGRGLADGSMMGELRRWNAEAPALVPASKHRLFCSSVDRRHSDRGIRMVADEDAAVHGG